MLTDTTRERARRFPPRHGGRVGIRAVGASARRTTRSVLLEPNGRRAARLVTALVQAKRAMNACGWMEAVPHPPRAAVRPRGAARLAIRALIVSSPGDAQLLASHPPPAEAVTEAPGLGRTRVGAATPPALQNRPRMRHGPAAPEGRQPDGGARATVRRLWSIPPRARRPLTTKEAFVSNRSATVAAAKRLMRQRPPATRRRRPS